MPRIIGVDIPENKKVLFALQFLYGIGPSRAQEIVTIAQVDPDKRARDLTAAEINRIQKALEKYPLEGDLRRMISDNIDRLRRIKSYAGSRHQSQMPVHGQRTRTNARTARGGGRRRTVGALSKEMAAKLEESKKK